VQAARETIMPKWSHRCVVRACGFLVILIWIQTARATENGQSHADLAYIDVLAGFPLLPGFYLRNDVNYNFSNRFNDQNGNKVSVSAGVLGSHPVKFLSNNLADVVATAYVPDATIPILGATFGTALYGFYAVSRAEAQFTIAGQTQGSGETRRGLGDLTVVPLFLQWTIANANLYIKLSPFEFTAPIGEYNPQDPIGNNIGLNYWSYRPAFLLTWLNSGYELSLNIGNSLNFTNPTTSYKSGDELYSTYVLQRYLSKSFAFGIEGYFYKQVTDDAQNGVIVNTTPPSNAFHSEDPLNEGPGNRGETFALGPTISFNPTENMFLNAHWVHEIFSYNRKQGDSIWIRASVRF
jgi:hypothetical protein